MAGRLRVDYDYLVVLTTCSSAEQAGVVARVLVDQSLAACVNIIPRVQSVYRWQGAVQTDEEYLLVIKASAANFDVIEQRIKSVHSYELPEIIAVPIVAGSKEYLKWVSSLEQL